MLQFPFSLEKIILNYIKQNFLKQRATGEFNDKDIRHFALGASRLSTAFTEERATLPSNYFNDPVLRSGYLLYFLPINLLKVMHILNDYEPRELTTGKVRVLDVGSGPGTGMLGVMSHYANLVQKKEIKDAWLDFTLIDKNFSILKDANHLHEIYKNDLENKIEGFHSLCSVKNFDFHRSGLNRFLRRFKYHLIIVSNVLNEFRDRDSQIQFIQYLFQEHLEPGNGKLILIEPALKKTSRDLQALRDALVLEGGRAFVDGPCLHQEVCPLNEANRRDWCHFYLSWKRPKFIEKVDRLIGNKKDWLQCSYLMLSHKERLQNSKNTWRVISNLMRSKGKKEVVLCGPRGRYHGMRLDKNFSPKNKSFDLIQRGDLVYFDAGGDGRPYRVDGNFVVEKGDEVKIIKKI